MTTRSNPNGNPRNLKLRVQLIATFDQLSSRLTDGDETAIEEAHSHIAGLVLCDDMPTLALTMKALSSMLESFQGEIDAGRFGAPDASRDNKEAAVSVSPDKPTMPVAAIQPSIQQAPGMKQETSDLGEGVAFLQWPAKMSPADYEDFEGWLQLVLRKVKRSAVDHAGE